MADILHTLKQFGLPVSLAGTGLVPEQILAATKNDKKMDSGRIRFILLHEIGEAYVDRTVTDEEMLDAVRWLMEEPGQTRL